MAKKIIGSTIVREALKAVVGEDKYKDLIIYADKRTDGKHRVKVQHVSWANLTEVEEQEVTDYIVSNYGEDVEVQRGQSGSRMLRYTAWVL